MDVGSRDESLTRAFIWAMEDLGSELRLVDASHLISYVLREAHANIGDLVASSCELLFKENTVAYAGSADMFVDWDRSPRVTLDMEFKNNGVSAKFELSLIGTATDVTINEIRFDVPDAPDMTMIDHLIEALIDARLKPPATEWSSRSLLN